MIGSFVIFFFSGLMLSLALLLELLFKTLRTLLRVRPKAWQRRALSWSSRSYAVYDLPDRGGDAACVTWQQCAEEWYVKYPEYDPETEAR